MGLIDDLRQEVNTMIDEMESDSINSRSQEFLNEFWALRNKIQDAIDITHEKEENDLIELLELLNRKGYDNDMENW